MTAKQDGRAYDKIGGQLSFIAIFVNFLGIAVQAFAIFQWISSLGFAIFEIGQIVVLAYIGTPALNFFIKMMIPLVILSNIKPEKKQRVAFAFMIIGTATMLPLILGGLDLIFILYTLFGIWLFLPHIIGGILLIGAGVALILWKVQPSAQMVFKASADVTAVSPTGDAKFCPTCDGGLFGDETFCPHCATLLKED